jgi:hypothetical protein
MAILAVILGQKLQTPAAGAHRVPCLDRSKCCADVERAQQACQCVIYTRQVTAAPALVSFVAVSTDQRPAANKWHGTSRQQILVLAICLTWLPTANKEEAVSQALLADTFVALE